VTRDRMMHALHQSWPQYDFAQHKGYVTPEHTAALQEHGPCPEHRFSYVNVRQAQASVRSSAAIGPRLGLDGAMESAAEVCA
jgi:ribonuclease HII